MMRIFEKNTKGKDFVVGDIHGSFSKLNDALDEVGFNVTTDRLFCTGDLVDRGPESELALTWLEFPWFFSVRGNHEDMAIGYVYSPGETPGSSSDGLYIQNGGQWFLNLTPSRQKLFADIFAELPTRIQVGDVGIVHAQAPLDWNEPDTYETMLWARTRISYRDKSGTANISKVYIGHTPVRSRTQFGNNIYIDTGAYMSGRNFTIEEINND